MNKCRIFIVRHTETIGNVEKRLTGREDYEITLLGKKYSELLTNALQNIKFDKIYSSTSNRTKRTIEHLAELNNKQIIQLEDLCEMYFGIYDGWKWDDVNKINPKIKENQILINEIAGIPNQESTDQVANRLYNCIYNIAKESIGETILICSHGVAIEAFLRKIVNKKFTDERELYCQHNTAINELYFENDKFNIVQVANIEHINRIRDEY